LYISIQAKNMVRSPFHILLLVFLFITAKGQDGRWKSSADSLTRIISTSASDQEKIDALHELSKILPPEKRTEALTFGKQALAIAMRNDDTREVVRSYTNLGNLYAANGEYKEAITYYHKAIRSSTSEKPFVAPAWLELARAYRQLSQVDSCSKALRKALEINESRKDPSLEGVGQNMLGELAREQRNYQESVAHFLKAADAFEKIGDKAALAQALLNAGDVHLRMGNYGLALEYTEQSIHHARESGHSLFMAAAYFQQGNICAMQRRLEAALGSYDKAIKLYRPLGDQIISASWQNRRGRRCVVRVWQYSQ
jgi:tetratricopeptide (TPR) repeat protein